MSDEFPGSFTGPYTDDDIQNTGDELRDADDYADYGYPIPYPPRKQDLA